MNMNEQIRQVYIETKVVLVKLNGLRDMLLRMEDFFPEDDKQRIKCELDRKGGIAAWDMLIDVLKASGLRAFKKFLKAINSRSFKAPEEVLEILEKACISNGLEESWKDSFEAEDNQSVTTNNALPLQEQVPGRQTQRENSLLSNATGSSFESERSRAWSTDSSEVFGASPQNSFDDSYANGAKAKRERFSSSGSREAIEIGSRKTRGSLKSASSRGSMEDSFATSILDPISKLRPQQRRELSDSLNRHNHIGNDWRMVAEKLGFESSTIAKIDTAPDQMSVILEHMQHRTLPIRILVEILNEMGRLDCIDILKRGGIVDLLSMDTDLNGPLHLQRTSSQVDETNSLPLQESARKKKDFQEDKIPSSSSDTEDFVDLPVQEKSEEKDPNQSTKTKESIQETKPKFINEESMPHGKGTFINKPVNRLGKNSEESSLNQKSVKEEKPTTCCTYVIPIDNKVTSKAKYSPVTHSLWQDEQPKISSKLSALAMKGAGALRHPEADGSIYAADERNQEAMIHQEADSNRAKTDGSLTHENEVLIRPDKGWQTSKDFQQEFEDDAPLFGSVEGRNAFASLTDEERKEDGDSDEDGVTPRRYELASPTDEGLTKKTELSVDGQPRQVFDSMEVKEKLVDPIKAEKLESSVEIVPAKMTQVMDPSSDADSGSLRSPTIAEAPRNYLSKANETSPDRPRSTPLLRSQGASNVSKSKEKEIPNSESTTHRLKEKTQAYDGNESMPIDDNLKQTATSFQLYSQVSTSTSQDSGVGDVVVKSGSVGHGQSEAESSKRHGTPRLCDDETTKTVSSEGQTETFPFERQNQESDSSVPIINPGSFSSISSWKSFVFGFFNSMGLGRQPAFPNRTPEDENSAGLVKRQSSLISRQFSTSNAVPSENFDEDERPPDSVEEVLATAGGKEMCIGASDVEEEKNEESTNLKKWFALIIDNHDYKHIETLPSENHSTRLQRSLEECGWEVERHENFAKKDLQSVIEEFSRKTTKQISFVFYYGHLIKAQGRTYILPIDMQPENAKTKSNRKKYAVDIDTILDKLSVAEASTVIIDAGKKLQNIPFECPTAVQHRNNQCVFLAKKTMPTEKFIAELLANRLNESETIRTIKDFMKPIEQYFEISASSRRCLPIIVKAMDPMEGHGNCWQDKPDSSWLRHAFIFKSNGSCDASLLKDKWLVNQCRDAINIDGDINAFMKVLDDDDPKVCLFYYEGPITMEKEELMLCPSETCNASCNVERKELSWILGRFSEIVIGPRIVIINATNVSHDGTELNVDDLNLQEVLLAISPPERRSEEAQHYHRELIQKLAEDHDVKDTIIGISQKFGFQTICSSLFHV